MNKFSGLKDTDREILKYVEDDELLRICSIDKRMWNSVCDDSFLKRRFMKYPGIEKYKKENESWKSFFLRAIYFIGKLKEDFQFNYEYGDFQEQYDMIKRYKNYSGLLFYASKRGELPLVKYSIMKGVDINAYRSESLRIAAQFGKLEVVKYLILKGADIHAEEDAALRMASHNGYLETVKWLVQQGADVHALDDGALKYARRNGHEAVINYLTGLI